MSARARRRGPRCYADAEAFQEIPPAPAHVEPEDGGSVHALKGTSARGSAALHDPWFDALRTIGVSASFPEGLYVVFPGKPNLVGQLSQQVLSAFAAAFGTKAHQPHLTRPMVRPPPVGTRNTRGRPWPPSRYRTNETVRYFISNVLSCVCGFSRGSFLAPATARSLRFQMMSPRVMSDS